MSDAAIESGDAHPRKPILRSQARLCDRDTLAALGTPTPASDTPLARIWHALCAGRAHEDVAIRLLVAFALAAVLWLSACVFLSLAPAA